MLQIETCGLPAPPQLNVETIEFPEHLILSPSSDYGYQIAVPSEISNRICIRMDRSAAISRGLRAKPLRRFLPSSLA